VSGVQRDLELAEQSRGRLEADVRQLTRERADISEQLSVTVRQKNSAGEQLVALRREVDRHVVSVDQLSKDKEALMTDKAQLSVHITAAERENQHLTDVRRPHQST